MDTPENMMARLEVVIDLMRHASVRGILLTQQQCRDMIAWLQEADLVKKDN